MILLTYYRVVEWNKAESFSVLFVKVSSCCYAKGSHSGTAQFPVLEGLWTVPNLMAHPYVQLSSWEYTVPMIPSLLCHADVRLEEGITCSCRAGNVPFQ